MRVCIFYFFIILYYFIGVFVHCVYFSDLQEDAQVGDDDSLSAGGSPPSDSGTPPASQPSGAKTAWAEGEFLFCFLFCFVFGVCVCVCVLSLIHI